jgi:RimJ/RimL family protein N-acetyltransferase
MERLVERAETANPVIETPRLILRRWRDEDLAPFAALNADPRVMEFLPKPLDWAESDAMAARIRGAFDQQPFGLWAVEVKAGTSFIGYVGLSVPKFEAAFTPCVEIGWRVAFDYWGRGYATEAARAALHYAFETLKLAEVVSFTVPANERSWRVMERLGMKRSPAEDFDHPNLAEGHPLRRHVLYRLSRP